VDQADKTEREKDSGKAQEKGERKEQEARCIDENGNI
jgi:hypothetical protein